MAETRAAIEVFVSYARVDTAIAERLVSDLEHRGIAVKIDQRDLPYGEAWQSELAGFIHGADTIVWLVSPASLTSRWCNWELGEAQRASKRLVPLRIADVAAEALPEALGRIHLLPADGVYDPAIHIDALVDTLNTDHGWIKDQTRFAGDSAAWIAAGRSRDLLLRGRALSEAEAWRDRRPASAPPIGPETLDLILESRRGSTGRLRTLGAVAVSTAAVLAVLAVVALLQRNDALEQRTVAQQQTARAEIAAETATLQREIAVARVEAEENPIAALERSARAARRNLATAEAGTIPVLEEIHAGLFVTLAAGRDMPPYWAAGTTLHPKARGVFDQPYSSMPPRRLFVTREQALLIDETGKPIARPIAGPGVMPGFHNAAIWFVSKQAVVFALASGEFLSDKPINVGVGIYDMDGKELVRLFADNPLPFTTLYYAFPKTLLAADSAGSIFTIDTETFEGRKIVEGAGLAIQGIQYASYDTPTRLMLAYGPAPASKIPRVESAPPQRASDPEVVRAALATAFGDPALRVQTTGTAADDAATCTATVGTSDGMLVCNARGGTSYWGMHPGKETPFAYVRPFNSAGAAPTAVAHNALLDAVAVGDSSGAIRIWSMSGQELSPILRQTQGAVAMLSFLPDGRTLLASGENDTIVRQWSLADLAWGKTYGKDVLTSDVDVTPDGTRRFAEIDGGLAVLGPKDEFFARYAYVEPDDARLAISASGRRVAWAEPDAVVTAAIDGEPVRLPFDGTLEVGLIELSADGGLLLAVLRGVGEYDLGASSTGYASAPLIRLYDLTSPAPVLVREWQDDPARPLTVALAGVTPDAPFLTGDLAGRIAGWDQTGELIWQHQLPLDPALKLQIKDLAASADGTTLLILARPFAYISLPDDFVAEPKLLLYSLADETFGPPLSPAQPVGPVAINRSATMAVTLTLRGDDDEDPTGLSVYSLPDFTRLATIPLHDTVDTISDLWFVDDGIVGGTTAYADRGTWHVGVTDLAATAEAQVDLVATSRAYDALMREATVAWENNDEDTAIATLRQATTDHPYSIDAWIRYGNYVLTSGPRAETAKSALAAYDRALALNPYDYISLVRRGRLHYLMGNFPGAVADYSEAASGAIRIPPLPEATGSSLDLQGSLAEYLVALRGSFDLETRSWLGYSLYKAGKVDEAADVLAKKTAEGGGDARDFEFLGFALAQLGRNSDALSAIDASIARLAAGGYSRIDDFSHQGDSVIKRRDKICDFAERAAPLTENAVQRRSWLSRAHTACSVVRWLDPDYPEIATRLARIANALAAPSRHLQGW